MDENQLADSRDTLRLTVLALIEKIVGLVSNAVGRALALNQQTATFRDEAEAARDAAITAAQQAQSGGNGGTPAAPRRRGARELFYQLI